MARTALMNVMVNAAFKAGRALSRDFGEVANLQVSRKGPADFVSAADRRSERIIHEELSKARPKWGFLMEESGEIRGEDAQHRFIVDPLDGTLNFLHGQPHFAVSIALEREARLFCGVVYDVAKNEIFWAERGRGCWLEQRKLHVANRRKLSESVIATGTPWHGNSEEAHAAFWGELAALTPVTAGIRRYGSAALDLAYVAAGRFDGFWERNLKPWDIAAGIVLVEEAGGLVDEIDGGDVLSTGCIVTSNEALHPELVTRLRKAKAFMPNAQS